MKILVTYKSKTEFTKRYAEIMAGYDIIVYGGGVYASGILGLSFLKKNMKQLMGKKIATFCVGASPYDEKAMTENREHNFKDDMKDIPCFYCRGAWNEDAMSFTDRNLCKLLKKAVAKQDPSTYEPWQKALVEAVGTKCDWTDKKYIEPIVEWVENV